MCSGLLSSHQSSHKSEETLRSREGRQAILAQILTAVNDQLIKLEMEPVVEEVVITELVLT